MNDTTSHQTSGSTSVASGSGRGGKVPKGTRPAPQSARDTANALVERTAAGIEANPLSALVGGVALGVLAGAFVPRGERETKLLGPVGKHLTDSAKGAIDAAKETARSEFDVLGLTRTAARGQATRLVEGVLGAVASASAAALNSQRKADAAAVAKDAE